MQQINHIATSGTWDLDVSKQRERFDRIVADYGGALQRLCIGFERVEARRDELLQEILSMLWASLPRYREEASLRTWTFRVAHNVAASHIGREIRRAGDVDNEPDAQPAEQKHSLDSDLDALRAVEKLRHAISTLRPVDRQVVLLYLEELPQADIAEITGLSLQNVSTRVARIKKLLADSMRRSA